MGKWGLLSRTAIILRGVVPGGTVVRIMWSVNRMIILKIFGKILCRYFVCDLEIIIFI